MEWVVKAKFGPAYRSQNDREHHYLHLAKIQGMKGISKVRLPIEIYTFLEIMSIEGRIHRGQLKRLCHCPQRTEIQEMKSISELPFPIEVYIFLSPNGGSKGGLRPNIPAL
jgi:hypothetical protein